MLPKKNRADKKAVERIFREGKFVNSPNLTFKFILANNPVLPRISFIVPKDIAKLAVRRNLLRRHGYFVLEKHIKQFPSGLLGVFIFKKYQDDVLILENEIENILYKIN
ncbi:MAG: ribonuclease P protein component [Patescibacteria group bacterium]